MDSFHITSRSGVWYSSYTTTGMFNLLMNVVEYPRDKLVPAATYVIAVIPSPASLLVSFLKKCSSSFYQGTVNCRLLYSEDVPVLGKFTNHIHDYKVFSVKEHFFLFVCFCIIVLDYLERPP